MLRYDGSDLKEYDLTDQLWDEFTSVGVFGNQVFWVYHVPKERDSVWKAEIGEDDKLIWDVEYRPEEEPATVSIHLLFSLYKFLCLCFFWY